MTTTPVERSLQVQPARDAPRAPVRPPLQGAIGTQPFVGRSALLVRVNEAGRICSSALTGTGGCSTDTDGFDILMSSIRIYDREVSCADLPRSRELDTAAPIIRLEVRGHWPFVPRTEWQVGDDDPITAPHVDAGFWSGSSGANVRGQLRVLEADEQGGVLELDLTSVNPDLPTAGTVSGTIAFTSCGPRPGAY